MNVINLYAGHVGDELRAQARSGKSMEDLLAEYENKLAFLTSDIDFSEGEVSEEDATAFQHYNECIDVLRIAIANHAMELAGYRLDDQAVPAIWERVSG